MTGSCAADQAAELIWKHVAGHGAFAAVIRAGERVVCPRSVRRMENEKQYEALKDKGMSKERAAKIANSPSASKHGGQKSGSGGDSRQGGTTGQKKAAGR
jgi:hypothetical protein